MNHTPGPWDIHWSMQGGDVHNVLVNNIDLIAKVDAFAPTDGDMEAQGKANAKLIAAAPELYEALARLVACNYDASAPSTIGAVKQARAALAKVEV